MFDVPRGTAVEEVACLPFARLCMKREPESGIRRPQAHERSQPTSPITIKRRDKLPSETCDVTAGNGKSLRCIIITSTFNTLETSRRVRAEVAGGMDPVLRSNFWTTPRDGSYKTVTINLNHPLKADPPCDTRLASATRRRRLASCPRLRVSAPILLQIYVATKQSWSV